MQGKGLVKVFLVLITVVCLLQFTYFIPTNRVESDAASYASSISGSEDPLNESCKTARARYLDSMSSEEVFSIPLLKSYTYNELKQQQLALGLDLKGGMSTTLQVDLEDFLKSLAGRNANNVEFLKALDNTREAMKSSQSNYITLFVSEYRTIAGDNKLAKIFARSETLGEISTSTTDGEIERLLRSKADQTVNLTFERLKQRIDRLGVAQPNVSLDPNRDLILVEMPGIDNPERAKQFLTASAKLEFWEVYRTTDPGISAAFQQADARASGASPSIDSTTVEMDTIKVPAYDDLGTLLPDSTIQLVPKAQNTATGATGSLFSALTLNSGTLSQSVMGLVEKGKKSFVFH